MHEVLVNRLGGLSLPRKSVVRLTDRPDMTLDVYRGRKTTKQHNTNARFPPFYCMLGANLGLPLNGDVSVMIEKMYHLSKQNTIII